MLRKQYSVWKNNIALQKWYRVKKEYYVKKKYSIWKNNIKLQKWYWVKQEYYVKKTILSLEK